MPQLPKEILALPPMLQIRDQKLWEPRVILLASVTLVWFQSQLLFYTASFFALPFISRHFATKRTKNQCKAIAGKLLTWWTEEPGAQASPGNPESSVRAVEEEWAILKYFQQTGPFSPFQLLFSSWERSLPLLSTAATCCGEIMQWGTFLKHRLFLWYLGEKGKKKTEDFPVEKKIYKYYEQ